MLAVLIPITLFAAWLWHLGRPGSNGLRIAFVRATITIFAAVAISTELLSLVHAVSFVGFVAVWTALSVIPILLIRNDLRDLAELFVSSVRQAAKDVPRIPSAVVLAVLSVTLVVALASPPNTYDSHTYHLARVMHWIQNASVSDYPTAILRQLYQPPLAEYAIMHLQVLSGSDRFANIVQWISLIGTAAAVSSIAYEVGLGRRSQAFAAALTVTVPSAIVQATGTQNDVVAAFFVVSFFLFFLRSVNGRGSDWIWTGAALGMALMTKSTTFLYCFPIGLFFAVTGFLIADHRADRLLLVRRVAFILIVAAAFNFGHFARNYSLFGSPVSSGDDEVRNRRINASIIGANLTRNFAMNLGTGITPVDEAVERSIRKVLGKEISNPDSTWMENEFDVRFSTHEDLAGNLLHVILLTAAIGIAAFFARRERGPFGIIGIIFSMVVGIVLFAILLKWQLWTARLQLPLFSLGTVLVAFAAERVSLRGMIPITLVCFVFAMPFMLAGEPRRLISMGERRGVFSEQRTPKLYKNLPDLGPLYAGAAGFIRQRKNPPTTVGIAIEFNDFEYPIWELLKDDPTGAPLIRHIGVTNASKALKPEGPAPDLVIATRTGNVFDGISYREVWKNDVVRVLEPFR